MNMRAVLVVGVLLGCATQVGPRAAESMRCVTLEGPGSAAEITATGAVLSFADERATFALRALGRERLVPVGDAEVARDGETIELRRGPVTEWWRSLPTGLEHGVTIDERPAGEGALLLDIAVGGLHAEPRSDDAVVLADASGARVATYAQLVVLDADERRVPARMAAVDGSIRIEVDDAGARYPIVVDPLLYAQAETTLLHPSGAASDYFGRAVALSADGTRAIVGADNDDTPGGTDAGSASVFVRTGTTWAHEATLVASGGAMNDSFGWSVAFDTNATRAVVGAPFDTVGGVVTGSARVFSRTGTTWTEEATLTASGAALSDSVGWSVALSGDGSLALVSAPRDDTSAGTDAGSVRVFTRTGTAWTEAALLAATGAAAGDWFGQSLRLTPDGTRAVIGAHRDIVGTIRAGSARIWLRSGSTWSEEAALMPTGARAGDEFGTAVALSDDGTRALVSAEFADTAGTDAGEVRVFTRAGTSWSEEASLTMPAGAMNDYFGTAVALSADGSRALVSARQSDHPGLNTGSAWLFLRSGTTWSGAGAILPSDAMPQDYFGTSVAMTPDGTRAVVGAFWDDTPGGMNAGSARVYTIAPGAADGASCSSGEACSSGHCVDGVCCASACAGGSNDCQACSGALTGVASGTCAALSAAVAPTVTCRAPTDDCDAAEVCAAGSTSCPADSLASAGTACRAAVDLCDAVERCSGVDRTCPADGLLATGVTCRPSTGPCDIAETCDGTRVVCPGDMFSPPGTACGGTVTPGTCAGAGLCNGTSALCPSATVRPAGAICLPAAPGVPCDVDDFCDGVTADCLARYAPATAACGSIMTDVCDAPDHCSGTSADCVFEFFSGVECRPSSGGCDPAEVCSGTAAACPPDQTSPSGTVCRTSTDLSCDPLESCDGTASACPADVNTCVAIPDADVGIDGGATPSDGGPGLDAPDVGGVASATTGCACRAGATTHGGTPSVAILAAVLGLLLRRRAGERATGCGTGAGRRSSSARPAAGSSSARPPR